MALRNPSANEQPKIMWLTVSPREVQTGQTFSSSSRIFFFTNSLLGKILACERIHAKNFLWREKSFPRQTFSKGHKQWERIRAYREQQSQVIRQV
jgi:hypothetical protein